MNASNRIITSMVVNSLLAIVLVGILFYQLKNLHKNYEFGLPMSEYLALKGNEINKQEPPKIVAKTDTIQGEYKPKVAPKKGEPIPSSGAPIVKPKTQPKTTTDTAQVAKPAEPTIIQQPSNAVFSHITWTSGKKPPVNFYHVMLFTLLAGALGGVLCNLRGIFKYSMEDAVLLEKMLLSYYIRPFMGAICGIFTYFVANLLITSLSVQPPVAEGIVFSNFIAAIGLAMIAGFGSYEFMNRLKETARTLFGGTAPKTEADRQRELIDQLNSLFTLKTNKVISEEEYNDLKEKVLTKLKDSGAADMGVMSLPKNK
jgi:hypothetical protein